MVDERETVSKALSVGAIVTTCQPLPNSLAMMSSVEPLKPLRRAQ